MARPLPNRFGKKYGYTALFPIAGAAGCSALRDLLGRLDQHPRGSPFSDVPLIHLLRFVIFDRLPFQGYPARSESLGTAYLIVMCDFDGADLTDLADPLVRQAGDAVYEVWRHCVAFPFAERGELDLDDAADRLAAFLRRGQVETLLYLSDWPEATVGQILRAIRAQIEFADFVARYQVAEPDELKERFFRLWNDLAGRPDPLPGSL
jgi:hypothetical protein